MKTQSTLMLLFLGMLACSSGGGRSNLTGPDPAPPPSSGAVNWQSVIPQVAPNVYAVAIETNQGLIVFGTAFSIAQSFVRGGSTGGLLATNAHVVEAIFEIQEDAQAAFEKGAITSYRFVAIRNNTALGSFGTFLIQWAVMHPEYTGSPFSPDVGIVHVDRSLPSAMVLAPTSELTALQVGQPIGTLGFPGEISGSDPQPIATFKDGTISALRTFSPSIPVTPSLTFIVQHNLATTGGTSGSPIFDGHGRVVAVSNSGVETIAVNPETGTSRRIPIGDLSFGIRADALRVLLQEYGVNASLGALIREIR